MAVSIRPMRSDDVVALGLAFADWPKDPAVFMGYAAQQEAAVRAVLVAEIAGCRAGYVTVLWVSAYRPFAAAAIPEISDLNVLPAFRARGIGGALLGAAEGVAAERSPVVGLGVGLYRDYGPAQRLSVSRGYVPDGCGVIVDGSSPDPGCTLILDDRPVLSLTKEVDVPGGPECEGRQGGSFRPAPTTLPAAAHGAPSPTEDDAARSARRNLQDRNGGEP